VLRVLQGLPIRPDQGCHTCRYTLRGQEKLNQINVSHL
jgi:hypothetical protein